MAPRLSGQTSIFGVVFCVFKSVFGIEGQKKHEKFAILTRKPRSHARTPLYKCVCMPKRPVAVSGLFPFERHVLPWYNNQGGERKGLIEQSRKKKKKNEKRR